MSLGMRALVKAKNKPSLPTPAGDIADMTEKEIVEEIQSYGYSATTSASKAMCIDMLLLIRKLNGG